MSVIEEVVAKVEDWKGRDISIQQLSGGLTNTNYRILVDGKPFFVRVPGASTDLLAIDRTNEYHNTQAAANAGVAPQVLNYFPQYNVMVLEFLQGTTMSKDSLNQPGMPTRMAQAIKKLHQGERFYSDFNMFRLTEYYLSLCREREIKIPEGYPERVPTVNEIEKAMSVKPLATVPCNNDLLAENYIDDGKQLWLIDYEYSGNNDACFELGNTATECEFTPELTDAWTEAYFGSPTKADIARVRLQTLVSAYGWSLWGFIQAGSSAIDYDFTGWGQHRFDKAKAAFRSPGFDTLLEEVARG